MYLRGPQRAQRVGPLQARKDSKVFASSSANEDEWLEGSIDASQSSVDESFEEGVDEGSIDEAGVEGEEKKKKKKKKKENKSNGAEAGEEQMMVRKRWSKLKESLHPTQTALGWDWVLFKMKNLATEEMAQSYLDRKPVPAVKRGDTYYIVDHHHTLAALEASGFQDIKVTVVVILEVPEDLCPIEFFWDFLEKRGWSFIRNKDYSHATPDALPKTFKMQDYNNDIYRSLGGFARVHKVLKRPKNLEARLFFEFKWAYFFFAHAEDDMGLWHDKRLHRSWQRVKALVEEVDMQEYVIGNMDKLNPSECIYLSENVIEPAYQLMMFYLRSLCLEYEKLSDEEKPGVVPAMSELFGEEQMVLPSGCVFQSDDFNYTFDEETANDSVFDEYGDENKFNEWRLSDKNFFGGKRSMGSSAYADSWTL